MAIIFTYGIGEDGQARIFPTPDGQPNFHADGNCQILGQVDLGGIRPIPMVLYGPAVRQPPLDIPVKPTLLVNQIADADSHKTSLQLAATLCERLEDIPVINHPRAVAETSRDIACEKLKDIPGVRVPTTIRSAPGLPEEFFGSIESAGMSLPVLVREAGRQEEPILVRLDDPQDAPALDVFALDGRDFLITEFVDCPDVGGLYHKQRFVMIDGQAILRHNQTSDQWQVNETTHQQYQQGPFAGDPLQFAEELENLRLPKALAGLEEIARRLGLEYLGIDCHINADGEILVFDASARLDKVFDNANGADPFATRVPAIKQALGTLVRTKAGPVFNFEGFDSPGMPTQ